MTKISDNINSYQNLAAYNADTNKDYPNVSYLIDEDELKWNKYDPEHIVCVYDVTSTSDATKLLHSNTFIAYQIIDGVQQQSVQKTYTFDTLGEHIVKYKLNGTSISDNFRSCTDLTSVTIPNTVTSIGDYTFNYSTSGPKSFTIGTGVTSIGHYVFYNLWYVESITIYATTPPSLTNNSIYISNNNWVIYVPAESVDTYKTATNWSTYASRIQAIPSE